jgi:hypothetical protein
MSAAFSIAAAVALLAANPAQAEVRTIKATAAQMFDLAGQLVRSGKPSDADKVLELLSRDPDPQVRNEARFRRARMFKASGQLQPAALLLRRILDDKPDAAPVRIELAQLLDRMGDKDGAWRELRAAQAAGLPPAVARIVDRYSEAIRAQRPMGASFEFALAPDSNINHATRSDTLGTIFGDFDIDRKSKAKSGLGMSLRGQAFRRFGLGNSDTDLLARASVSGDLYRKSDFNDVVADVAIGPELHVGRNQLNIELGATQRWYGQKPFARSVRAGLGWVRPLGRRTQLRLNASASVTDNQFNDLQDGKAFQGRVGVERALSATTGVALNLALDRESLRDPGYSTTGWRAGIVAWKEIGRATLTASADFGRLDADERLLLFPDKRRDRYSRFSLATAFRQLTFKGFAPVTRFTFERNRSTIEFYDFKRTRTEIALVRAF